MIESLEQGHRCSGDCDIPRQSPQYQASLVWSVFYCGEGSRGLLRARFSMGRARRCFQPPRGHVDYSETWRQAHHDGMSETTQQPGVLEARKFDTQCVCDFQEL